MDSNELTMARECGRVVLWVGNEAKDWTLAQFAAEAEFARSLGADSICVKVSDGGLKWFSDAAHLKAIREAVLAKGCGFIPFIYCYGPKFGTQQIHDECAILAEMMSVCPVVQADMEAEWDGQVAAAQLFASLMRPVPGLLSVSTWADPNQQNWQGVIHALAPCVNAWTPQQYTDWLAAQEPAGQLAGMGLTLQPGVDLAPEFGSDHVLSIATQAVQRGHHTLYLWETATARTNPALVRAVVAEMAKLPPLPALTVSALSAPLGQETQHATEDTTGALAQRGAVLETSDEGGEGGGQGDAAGGSVSDAQTAAPRNASPLPASESASAALDAASEPASAAVAASDAPHEPAETASAAPSAAPSATSEPPTEASSAAEAPLAPSEPPHLVQISGPTIVD